ncbi:MAG TPA: hypothetical protein VF457_09695 [Burkholderiaceae bacterium]
MHHRRHLHALHRVPFGRVTLLDLSAFRLRRQLVWGGGMVAAGVLWLLEGQGLIGRDELWLVAPAVLAWSGLVRLALGRSLAAGLQALLRLAVAAYLVAAIEHVGGWSFAVTWPVLLIGFGVAYLVHALLGHADACRDARAASEEPSW